MYSDYTDSTGYGKKQYQKYTYKNEQNEWNLKKKAVYGF